VKTAITDDYSVLQKITKNVTLNLFQGLDFNMSYAVFSKNVVITGFREMQDILWDNAWK
jgi:hypothetical protein